MRELIMKWLIEIIKAVLGTIFGTILSKPVEKEESYHDIGPENDDPKVNRRDPFTDDDW